MGINDFFGLHIDPVALSGQSVTILLAVVLGGVVGLERQWHGNAAGMRTHILVCVGAAIITITSKEIGMGLADGVKGDPGHIAAQIVSGVGFLGAGAILREGTTVRGLTTAASIWTTAGIGIALGASPHLAELAVVTTLAVLGTLVVLERVEVFVHLKQPLHTLEVEVREAHQGPARVLDLLTKQGVSVTGLRSDASDASLQNGGLDTARRMRMQLTLPRGFDRSQLNQPLTEEKGVIAFHWE